MKKYFSILSLLLSVKCFSQLNIVPMPAEVKMGKGNFILSSSTKIILQGSNLEKTAAFLNNYIKKNYGFSLKVQKDIAIENTIVLNYERMNKPIGSAYKMDINKNEIYIAGDNEAGVFYGIKKLFIIHSANIHYRLPPLCIQGNAP